MRSSHNIQGVGGQVGTCSVFQRILGCSRGASKLCTSISLIPTLNEVYKPFIVPAIQLLLQHNMPTLVFISFVNLSCAKYADIAIVL